MAESVRSLARPTEPAGARPDSHGAALDALAQAQLSGATRLISTEAAAAIERFSDPALLASGKVNNYGPTGVKVTEGWWYPQYLVEVCPGLPSWEALKQPKCAAALATAGTAPKGRFVDAPADWGSRSDERISHFELPFALVNSGSPAALLATFQGAIDRKQPILGWMYTPNWFTEKNPGAFVQFPDSRPEVDVLKLGNKAAFARIPVAEKILQKFTLDKGAVAKAMDQIDNEGSSPEEEADTWISAHADLVQGWAK